MNHFLIWLAGASSLAGCQTIDKPEDKLPNVVFIYTDDLGRGMLSHEGQQIVICSKGELAYELSRARKFLKVFFVFFR